MNASKQSCRRIRAPLRVVVVAVALGAGWVCDGQADEPAQETAKNVELSAEPKRGWDAPLTGMLSAGGLISLDRDVREYPYFHSGSVRFAKDGSDISRIRFGEGDRHGVSAVFCVGF